ncbi:hypothetical protein C8J56DRAFT_1051906 [Mycena floridula]|nr:hypothetical protein C8J56DRAFT_1051906 [Mycena floridula]
MELLASCCNVAFYAALFLKEFVMFRLDYRRGGHVFGLLICAGCPQRGHCLTIWVELIVFDKGILFARAISFDKGATHAGTGWSTIVAVEA